MKKLTLLAMVVGLILMVIASAQGITWENFANVDGTMWYKDTEKATENGQIIYEWWYVSPLVALPGGTSKGRRPY